MCPKFDYSQRLSGRSISQFVNNNFLWCTGILRYFKQFEKKAKTKISVFFFQNQHLTSSCILNIGRGVIKYSEKALHALVTPKWFNASWCDVCSTEVVTHHGSSFPFQGLHNQQNTPKSTNIHFVDCSPHPMESNFYFFQACRLTEAFLHAYLV